MRAISSANSRPHFSPIGYVGVIHTAPEGCKAAAYLRISGKSDWSLLAVQDCKVDVEEYLQLGLLQLV
jgi:hypothetical protein